MTHGLQRGNRFYLVLRAAALVVSPDNYSKKQVEVRISLIEGVISSIELLL